MATAKPVDILTSAIDCLEILDKRPRPMCRDCADEDGTCPHGGLACGMRVLIADARACIANLATQSQPTQREGAFNMATASVTKHTLYRVSLELTEEEKKLFSLILQNVKHDNGTASMRICRTVFEALNSPVVEE